jgi:phosphopantothenoylcysteine decarboxylase/phosphopantothenate--cysteine ligase
VIVVEPDSGRLAGGDIGSGRLAAPERILAELERAVRPADLLGLHIVVTAGGTREPIDAVRFITNRSSGKQGHAIADEVVSRGGTVTLVTTTALAAPAGATVIRVDTAAQMHDAVMGAVDQADAVVMAAAVADFRPVAAVTGKIKKDSGPPELVLEPTVDILAALGQRKRPGLVLVGFAAETGDLEAHAAAKLARKHLDLVVANDVSQPGVGFDHDTNAVTLLAASGERTVVHLASKRAIAAVIVDELAKVFRTHRSGDHP